MLQKEEKAIANLKYYIEQDPYYNGTYSPVTDFEKYCYEHCNDIGVILSELEQKDKEVQELKKLMEHKNGYTHLLEEDLFANASNYVIPKSEIEKLIQNETININGFNYIPFNVVQNLLKNKE